MAEGPRRLGPFLLLRELGRGGMGTVYAARDALGRDVALKVIQPEAFLDEEGIARFGREAESAARIEHPNVVRVFAAGQAAGTHYLALELVEGEDLEGRLKREGRLAPAEAVELTRQLCAGVEAAHAAGVLHRDLKPANVLLRGGQAVLTDFGLARRLDASRQLTQTGQVLGTPAMMAPEQAGSGGEVGAWTDVYGLGATLYMLLTGAAPCAGVSLLDTLDRVLTRPPAPPSELLGVPLDPRLEAIVLRCLAKTKEERYPSASAVSEALATWAAGGAEPAPRGGALAAGLALGVLALAGVGAAGLGAGEAGVSAASPARTPRGPTQTPAPSTSPSPSPSASQASARARLSALEAVLAEDQSWSDREGLWLESARTLRELGRFGEARVFVERLLLEGLHSGTVHSGWIERGRLELAQGRLAEARLQVQLVHLLPKLSESLRGDLQALTAQLPPPGPPAPEADVLAARARRATSEQRPWVAYDLARKAFRLAERSPGVLAAYAEACVDLLGLPDAPWLHFDEVKTLLMLRRTLAAGAEEGPAWEALLARLRSRWLRRDPLDASRDNIELLVRSFRALRQLSKSPGLGLEHRSRCAADALQIVLHVPSPQFVSDGQALVQEWQTWAPDDWRPRFWEGWLSFAADREAALRALRAAALAAPPARGARGWALEQVVAWTMGSDHQGAAQLLERLEGVSPQPGHQRRCALLRGDVLALAGRAERAREVMTRALEAWPAQEHHRSRLKALRLLCRLAAQDPQAAAAWQLLEADLRAARDPRVKAELALVRAKVQRDLRQRSAALEASRRARRLDPSFAEPYVFEASLLAPGPARAEVVAAGLRQVSERAGRSSLERFKPGKKH